MARSISASASSCGVAGLRIRKPRVGLGRRFGVAVEVEEDGCYVNSGDAVDEAVVGLGDEREAVPLHAIDQPDLPDRLAAVKALREDPRGERSQLILAARGREGGMADVVVEVQVGIVDPDGATLSEGDEAQLLPEARHQVKPRGDVVAELLVGGRRALEQGRRGDVHVGGAVLQVEEGGVQPAEPVPVGHGPNLLKVERQAPGRVRGVRGSRLLLRHGHEAADADPQQPHRGVELELGQQLAGH